MSDIQHRKADHIELAARGDVGFKAKTTLLECVELVHCALPELDSRAVDTSLSLFGRKLSAPLLIAAMTGGTARAAEINRALSGIAEERGIAFGLGSQRPMLLNPDAAASFQVRRPGSELLLLSNIGIVQATALPSSRVQELVDTVAADAICVHLNPAMELIQADGDRDFSHGLDTLARLVRDLNVPVIAKETGCGLSLSVARAVRAIGVSAVDVSGAGGTSWVAVETHRAEGEQRSLGQLLWDWGIPTAASLLAVRRAEFASVIATGGLNNGLDAARAIALGANLVGIARPVLQAYEQGGAKQVHVYLDRVERELRSVMTLVGAANLKRLREVPRLITGNLRSWKELWAENAER